MLQQMEARAGFERIFAETSDKLAVLEEHKKIAMDKAAAEVEAEIADQKAILEQVLGLVGVEVERMSNEEAQVLIDNDEAEIPEPTEQEETPADTFQFGK